MLPDDFAVSGGRAGFRRPRSAGDAARRAPRAARARDRLHPAGAAERAQSGAHHRQRSSASIWRISASGRARERRARAVALLELGAICRDAAKRCCAIRTNCRAAMPARADRDGVRRRAALVVADEPTTALDVMTQARIVRLIADSRRSTAPRCCSSPTTCGSRPCLRRHRGDVCRRHGGVRPGARVLQRPVASLYESLLPPMPALTGAASRAAGVVRSHAGIASVASASRLPLRAALSEGRSRMRR